MMGSRAALALALLVPSSGRALEPMSLEAAGQAAGNLIAGARSIGRKEAAAEPGGLSYSSVCGADASAMASQRAERLQKGLRSLDPQLLPRFKELAAKYGLLAPSGDNYMSSTLTSITYTYPQNVGKAKEALAAFAEAIEQAVLARVPAPDYGRIQAALTSAIRGQTGLSEEAKAELVRRVGLTKMVLPSQYIREYISTTEDLWPVVSQLTADQAWNASYQDLGGAAAPGLPKDTSLVILYPGFLLAEDRGDGRPRLDYVLAHETGHSMDSGRFPGLYASYIDCMKRRNGTRFKNWDEVLADTWAAETLAALGSGAAGELGKSLEIVCGTSGEAADPILGSITTADHPSGQYRIDKVLGGNASLGRALGLPSDPAACRL